MLRSRLFAWALLALFMAASARGAKPEAAAGAVRLLVLPAFGEATEETRVAISALVSDALRGRGGLLAILPEDVRARAPMEADRMEAGCRDKLCLFELTSAVNADYALVAEVASAKDGISVELALFRHALGHVVAEETAWGETLEDLAPSVEAGVDRLLAHVEADAAPGLFEDRLFLSGAGITAVGAAFLLGALGWLAEMEATVSDPDKHRDAKARALDDAPRALLLAVGAATVTAVGLSLLGLSLFE